MTNVAEIIESMTKCNIRPTQQRIAVYDYLLTHRNHPSADTIYTDLLKIFPVFSRTTIYNSLNALVDAGLVRVLSITPDEQRFDANVDDHGHFYCKTCNTIIDFKIDSQSLSTLCPENCSYSHGDVFINGNCSKCSGTVN